MCRSSRETRRAEIRRQKETPLAGYGDRPVLGAPREPFLFGPLARLSVNAKKGGRGGRLKRYGTGLRQPATDIPTGAAEAVTAVSGLLSSKAKICSRAHIVPPASTSPMKNRIVQKALSHRRCMK